MFYRISQIFECFKSPAKTREEKKTPFVRICIIWLTIILQQRSNMCASRNINLIRRLILNLKPITFNNKTEKQGMQEREMKNMIYVFVEDGNNRYKITTFFLFIYLNRVCSVYRLQTIYLYSIFKKI